MFRFPAALPALLFVLSTTTSPGAAVRSAREAKTIAEQETGGIARSARKIYLNGATCGWEVIVHMPGESRGWRCVVDCDTRAVFTKTRIPDPGPPARRP